MSDTMQLVLWIVLGLVIVALVIWVLVSGSRRRKREAQQRAEAASLRASVEERLPELQDAEDRASVTGQIAQDARAEAEAKDAEAARLERQAEEHRAEAQSAQQERERLEREADRIDPDVLTDEEGRRVDESGRRRDAETEQLEERGAFGRPGGAPGSVAAGAALAGSGAAGAAAAAGRATGPRAFTEEDDEPDLADAENPFADQAASTEPGREPVPPAAPDVSVERALDVPPSSAPEAPVADESEDADWVNGPVEDLDDEELEASAAEESAAPDWINGPEGDGADVAGAVGTGTGHASAPDAREDETMTTDDADWINGPVEEVDDEELEASAAQESAAADWINGPEDEDLAATRPERATEDPMAVEEVSVPALEDRDEFIAGGGTPSDDPGDHRGQPWSTDLTEPAGPRAASGAAREPAAPAGHADEGALPQPGAAPVAERSQRPFDREERLDVEPAPEPAGSEVPPLAEPETGEPDESGADGGSRPGRRISSFDEVRDGGFGIGSASPLDDGAQPLGHAVKGFRDSSTFLAPGGPGYDEAEPDVWFFNEEAARRAGFTPGGQ